jgi:carboxymethylenebutenolidase
VHEWIKDICRRLAKMGYYAIAPELYAREGDPTKISDTNQLMKEIVSKVPDQQVMSDLDAAVAFAKSSGKADTAKLGITGFCWGGRIVWMYAGHNPNLKAAVAWYGHVATSFHPATRRQWTSCPTSRRRCWAFTATTTRAFLRTRRRKSKTR